jgi:hypothetical protein
LGRSAKQVNVFAGLVIVGLRGGICARDRPLARRGISSGQIFVDKTPENEEI